MRIERIGVAGAGTMGSGIAQLACLAGQRTTLHDPDPEALARAGERIRADLAKGADRGRWTRAEAEAAPARLRTAPAVAQLAGCELVIEAAPEDLELKRELFSRLEATCGREAILATNTSSLRVGEIAAPLERPARVCGMHFFNPPALMRLVEVVAAPATSEAAVEAASAVARRMRREPIRCADSVGFVVNRCNRPFTLEALRVLDEGIAGHAEIDFALRAGGYPMGPFELMDLIGVDVNLEVARSFHAQRREPRWRPHPIQERMVAAGRLGRKAGRGFYDYGGDAREPDPEPPPPALRARILERIVAQLVNEASFALEEGVADPDAIDRAMRLGLNHPRGPFEWAGELGPERVLATLDALGGEVGDERYRACGLLRRWAAAGGAKPPQR